MIKGKQQQLDNLLNDDYQNQSGFGANLSSGIEAIQTDFMRNGYKYDDSEEEDKSQEYEIDRQYYEQSFRQKNKLKDIFPEVVGSSYNVNDCSQNSMSMSKRMDEIQPRNSQKIDFDMEKFYENKKKQEIAVNQVLEKEYGELIEENDKYKIIINQFERKVQDLEDQVEQLKREKQEIEEQKRGIQQKQNSLYEMMKKKDSLYHEVKLTCSHIQSSFKEKEKQLSEAIDRNKKLEDEIMRLKEGLRNYTSQEKGLTDFRNLTLKREHDSMKEKSNSKFNFEKEFQKIKRQKNILQTEFDKLKQQIAQKQLKFKSLEDELKRKISTKQRKVKELQQGMSYAKEQISKSRKTTQSSTTSLKQHIHKLERQVKEKEDKLQELQKRYRMSNEDLKRKDEKINQKLTQISQRNKKINELKDKLKEEEAKNEIETKIQIEREKMNEQLEKQIKFLKNQKSTLQRKVSNSQKQTNIEMKLKKQMSQYKKELEKKEEQLQEAATEIYNLGSEGVEKDKKIKELKKKTDELSKKASNIKAKSSDIQNFQLEVTGYKEKINKLNKQLNDCKKKLQQNQQKVNRQYILQTMGSMNREEHQSFEYQNQFHPEEQIEALQIAIQERDKEIKKLKYAHKMEISRYEEQLQTLKNLIIEKQNELQFRQKSLNYLHDKYLTLEKQKAQLQINRNVLHSSFYDQSYEDEDAIRFYESKIQTLEEKIRQKEAQIQKMSSSFEGRDSDRFEKNQMKNRIKELTQMLLASEKRKIAPQSLSPQETVEFLLKTMKRVYKSGDMIKMLSRQQNFREVIFNMNKVMEKQARRK